MLKKINNRVLDPMKLTSEVSNYIYSRFIGRLMLTTIGMYLIVTTFTVKILGKSQ